MSLKSLTLAFAVLGATLFAAETEQPAAETEQPAAESTGNRFNQPGSIKLSADYVYRNFKDAKTILDDSKFSGLRLGLGKELDNGFAVEAGVNYYSVDLDNNLGEDLGGLEIYVMDLGLSKTFYIWRVALKAEAGGTVTYVDLDLGDGLVELKDDEFLFGAYGSLGLGFQITKNLMVSAEARYDYTEDFDDSDYSLSGESIGFGIEYRF